MTRISLEPTVEFQARIERHVDRFGNDVAQLTSAAIDLVRKAGMVFEAKRELQVGLTPLLLSDADYQSLRSMVETLHGIVERALDWLHDDPQRLDEFFSDHTRFFPFLKKTPGSSSWQIISRYDAIVERSGDVRIIELNTACPAGFFHSHGMAEITRQLLEQLSPELADSISGSGAISNQALANQIISTETSSGIAPGLIALVNDENQLLNELNLLVADLQHRGRQASIVPADQIEFVQGQACWQGHAISSSFNKVRLSTPRSPNHRWSPGFEDRYQGFLAGMSHGAFAGMNNVMGLSIAEDKGLLAVLRHPSFQSELSSDESRFVEEHVLSTARLTEGSTIWRGSDCELLAQVRTEQEAFVVKPANEGRGFGLCVGRAADSEQWEAACRVDPDMPKVIQEYVEPARVRVSRLQGESVEADEMYLTIGLAMLGGRFQGLLSRISRNPVTNISQSGMVQAVFLTNESGAAQ